jgi:hypothetical protein
VRADRRALRRSENSAAELFHPHVHHGASILLGRDENRVLSGHQGVCDLCHEVREGIRLVQIPEQTHHRAHPGPDGSTGTSAEHPD